MANFEPHIRSFALNGGGIRVSLYTKQATLPPIIAEKFSDYISLDLEYQYKDLQCEQSGFSVFLRFSGAWYAVFVPYSAIYKVVDLHTGLDYEPKSAKIVYLDDFRQKTGPKPPPSAA